ncbi:MULTISPECIES: helix-turn-helix domain-containing protein [Rossellomorea]|jgi:DNA-binding XRE family transcriptional regulator|uniref:helix-turn-helix domain-containing protein n=1 Tax=Rossellomorea TaxID=2837508 RepID=UPI00191B3024|nr:helix-turn-helix transcriptional regulator [Rossellomorea arthrocnemi]
MYSVDENVKITKLSEVEALTDVEKLIVLRKRLGNKKQYEFARDIGISPNYLVAIENYRQPFTEKLAMKINDYLKGLETEHRAYDQSINLPK